MANSVALGSLSALTCKGAALSTASRTHTTWSQAGRDTLFTGRKKFSVRHPPTPRHQQAAPQVSLARGSTGPCSASEKAAAVSILWSLLVLPGERARREMLLRMHPTEAVNRCGPLLPELKPLVSPGPVLLPGAPTTVLVLLSSREVLEMFNSGRYDSS